MCHDELVDARRQRVAPQVDGRDRTIAVEQDRDGQLLDPEQARIIELRYFGGLTLEETADAAGVSLATVKRQFAMARAWLKRALEGDAPGTDA